MRQSTSSSSGGRPAARSARARASASGPPGWASTAQPKACSRSASAARASGRSSTSSTRRPCSMAGAGGAGAGASATPSQAVNQNRLPRPGALSRPISPPISRARWRLSARPRPVPPWRRVVALSACSKASNSRACCAGAMPMPESATSKRTCCRLPCTCSSSPRSRTQPVSVNLTALASRLISAWASRVGSPRSRGGRWSVSSTSSSPFSAARPRTISKLPATRSSSANSVSCSTILPASIFDRSRMSLITCSRWRAASSTLPSRWRCSGASTSRAIRWVRPMIAFIGVRISWLMLARKALLARVAASAWSRAAASEALASRSAAVRSATRSSSRSRCSASSS